MKPFSVPKWLIACAAPRLGTGGSRENPWRKLSPPAPRAVVSLAGSSTAGTLFWQQVKGVAVATSGAVRRASVNVGGAGTAAAAPPSVFGACVFYPRSRFTRRARFRRADPSNLPAAANWPPHRPATTRAAEFTWILTRGTHKDARLPKSCVA